jgi:hypothetical protein
VPLGTFYSRIGRGRIALRRIIEDLKTKRPKLVVCMEKNE